MELGVGWNWPVQPIKCQSSDDINQLTQSKIEILHDLTVVQNFFEHLNFRMQANQLRYRVFDGKQKYIFTLEDLMDARTLVNRGGNFKFPNGDTTTLIVHRSTGLLDINDKEIFEGDILEDQIPVDKSYYKKTLRYSVVVYKTLRRYHKLEYDKIHSQFGVYVIDSWLNLDGNQIPDPIEEECRIIGNIVENKELLELATKVT
jgi:uncharacterized phage protein (TIGR01671 family)